MRFYIAGSYAERDSLRHLIPIYESQGHEVTSRWLQATHEIHIGTVGAAEAHSDEQVIRHVKDDLYDIDRAHALVMYVPKLGTLMSTSGGRHVETGYALAQGMRVFIVGRPENVFHRACTVVPNTAALWEAL